MFCRERTALFCEQGGAAVLRAQVKNATAGGAAPSEERVLNIDLDALVSYVVEKYCVEVPIPDLDYATASEQEGSIEVHDRYDRATRGVPGTAFDFEIPFTGGAQIFRMRPNSYVTASSYAVIREQKICFSVEGSNLTQAYAKCL